MICKHCNGNGEEPPKHTYLSCIECNGMGELYDDDE